MKTPTFSLSEANPPVFGITEIVIEFGQPVVDPFRPVSVSAVVGDPAGNSLSLEGFCDAQDGSVYRVRVMPKIVGEHSVRIQVGEHSHDFTFIAEESPHEGLLVPDGRHFRYSKSGRFFFWNATTAYLLAGLAEDTMALAIDRLSNLGINRIRVSLCPTRQVDGGRWYEAQVAPRRDFTFSYGPWLNGQPDDILNPIWDLHRFEVAYWQKFDRLVAQAAKAGIQVQVIFYTDGQEDRNYPFDRSDPVPCAEEFAYHRYAVARLAAYANVEWCVTNEWAVFRSDEWASTMGQFLADRDPYGHLLSVHGHGHFPFRTEAWPTHALFQVWDEDGAYDWVLQRRAEPGRVLPIVNEEYGYEDHYPGPWGGGKSAPARSADSRRRLAWEISMAGGYQTTGESAANGLGGWINGLGDDSMTMLDGYRHLRTFFESIPWWRMEPRPDLVAAPVRCLAETGVRHVVYSPDGRVPETRFPTDGFRTRIFNPRSGDFTDAVSDSGDWVFLWEAT